ncbi:unnamed protein product [Plutella xylostella]|uniref:(diamondback moth) hypothetical protein n=1 Tax=Plutella xylostella TaxID=51655 RepID=A0A8S4G6A3_PLUXY|nr:unnamed protein product [Plutella xylostella]
MLTIAFLISVTFFCFYLTKFLFKRRSEKEPKKGVIMADQQEGQEQVRCSSRLPTNFTVGDSPDADDDDSGPSHEGGDSFPNAPPPNIRRVLTQAQQLALAEKRSTLRKEGEDEATEAIPNNLLQKFQMTLDAEPEGKSREQSPERRGSIQDGTRSGLLRPPASTSTLQ